MNTNILHKNASKYKTSLKGLVEKITILKEKTEVEDLINKFSSEFLFNEFPLPILKNDNMKFMFINTRIFDVEYSYTQFLSFLYKNNVSQYYILPGDINSYDWQDYENEHILKKENHFYKTTPVFLIKNEPDFKKTRAMCLNPKHFLMYQEFFIFSEELDWMVNFVPHRNFAMLYYKPNILFDGLNILDEELTNLVDLIENAKLEDGFDKEEIKSLESYWFPIYNNQI